MIAEVNSEVGWGDGCKLTDQVVPSPELASPPHISEPGLVLFPAPGEV